MKFLLFLGSVRNSTPPRPARLGERVAKVALAYFSKQVAEHQIELIDALDYPLEPVFKPHFAYAKAQAPAALSALAEKIAAADGYIMLSPEYNHSMSPALANLLNHFGSSLFSYKPSAIMTYSAGQWGGMRAAIGMRSFLAELGCLPVSAMIHLPKAQELFTAEGEAQADVDMASWLNYMGRTFTQLIWWAAATKAQRECQDPAQLLQAFQRTPAERNAP